MPKKLTPEQVLHYRDQGFISPVDGLTPEKTAEYRQRLEESEKIFGPIMKENRQDRAHLLFRWADELVREPAILDAIEDLIGPDILIYTVKVWPKEPGSPGFVSWHQDHTYQMLDCDSVSAWLSLTNTSVEAGCMEVAPGSHKMGKIEHEETYGKDNMLSKGQTIVQADKLTHTCFMPLKPGQFSLHHSKLAHCSGLNNSSDRRIGVAINCIPTSGKTTSKSNLRPRATLARGEDRFGTFDFDPAPKSDYDEEARAAHSNAIRNYNEMKATTVR